MEEGWTGGVNKVRIRERFRNHGLLLISIFMLIMAIGVGCESPEKEENTAKQSVDLASVESLVESVLNWPELKPYLEDDSTGESVLLVSSPWLSGSLDIEAQGRLVRVVPSPWVDDDYIEFQGIYIVEDIAFVAMVYRPMGIRGDLSFTRSSDGWKLKEGVLNQF